jgi:general secretion pathway protein H
MRILRAGHRTSEQGYTLLELLVVLTILTVATAATSQLVVRRPPAVQLNASSAIVASILREARSIAIRDNREQAVVIDLGVRTLQIGSAGRKHQLEGSIGISLVTAISELEGQRGAIRFFPDGTSTGGRVRLSDDARTNEIVVQWLTGHVKIREDLQ